MLGIAIVLFVIAIAMLFWGFSSGNEFTYKDERGRRWRVMKRRKDLEYRWILKGAFFVQAYTAQLENGKRLVVYAHDFNDMEFFLSKLEVNEARIAEQSTDSDFVPKKRMLSYLPDKHGEPQSKPFWYRGRVYEVN